MRVCVCEAYEFSLYGLWMKSAPKMEVMLFDPGHEVRRERQSDGEEEKGDAVCTRTHVCVTH